MKADLPILRTLAPFEISSPRLPEGVEYFDASRHEIEGDARTLVLAQPLNGLRHERSETLAH